jgi:hypothetical protein
MEVMLIIVGVLVAIGLIYLAVKAAIEAQKRAQQRIDDMGQFASDMGLSFSQALDSDHDDEFAHFEIFRRGFDRFAYNTISGDVDLGAAIARCTTGDFTYKTRETYTTTDSKGRTTTRTRIVKHNFSYFILELPYIRMPDMMIRREGLFDKIAAAFGKNDIDFESSEFSRKYYVKCDNRKFAYDIINPRMMEFMLQTKPGLIDIENSRICLADGYATWPAERFSGSLGWALKFIEHWPDFVIKDLEEGKIV